MLHQQSEHDRGRCCDGDRPRRSLFRSGLPLRPSAVVDATKILTASVLAITLIPSAVATAQLPVETAELTPLSSAAAPGTPSATTLSATEQLSAQQARAAVQSLLNLALSKTPRRYDGDKHWGDTKKIWSGVRLRRDGLRLSTKRRWREVQHGLQTRYHVQFPDQPGGQPNAPLPLVAQVRSVQTVPANEQSSAGWQIDCTLTTPLDFAARIERWNLGMQFYSVEVSGHMTVRMDVRARLSARPDYSDIPPAIVIDPKIELATLHLDALHVDRVSKVGGEVAEQWGEIAERIVKEILLDDFNEKLPATLNKSIDKHRDDLRLSLSDWVANLTKQ
ncbi:hypothetical protein NHH03_05400 [Stieleria sp. TO1_6]|uniref:hypothetical protein n=1 Tax=Stieleria tagensis TaxID=2956795 RepID=UPI00209AE0DD|nr:hypothetical protein [Stieleria tagensis]MCO8121164.1 hypothetical protein [Stieleria tagensis]